MYPTNQPYTEYIVYLETTSAENDNWYMVHQLLVYTLATTISYCILYLFFWSIYFEGIVFIQLIEHDDFPHIGLIPS